jgi:predicted amidohydrolase
VITANFGSRLTVDEMMSVHVPQIVAAVQFAPVLLDVRKNLQTALQLTFEAATKGASVIVLPELCMGGSTLDGPAEAMLCAQTRDGYQTQAMGTIADAYNCHIAFGYVELMDGKLYNSACIVGPGGAITNVQKRNLWGRDNMWAQPSENQSPLVITRSGRLGALICRDAMNKYRESYRFRNAKQRFYHPGSVDTIALLTNWGQGFGYPDSSWVELAEETRANVIVSNRVGEERDMQFKGGSCIIDRNRRIWTNGSSFTEPAVVGGVIL